MLRILLCDIDGCLGSEDTAPFDLHALHEIAAWNVAAQRERAAGVEHSRPIITVCSGRPQPYAEAISRMIANASVPIVCEMGVWLYDPRDNRYAMDPAISPSHLEAIAACQAWVRAELSPIGIVMQPGKVASISLWHKDTAELLSMQEAVRERVSKEGWGLRVSSTVAWINLDLAHVSKGTGIDRLLTQLEREGTPAHREGLFGIGDTMTDMAIRDRVAWFGCPSNADARLKAQADFVASSEHARGVVECLVEVGKKTCSD